MDSSSLTNIRKNGDILHFTLTNSYTALANALRRVMIADVPSIAIEYVTVYENDSIIQDEIVVHRLGLIPLVTDLGTVSRFNYTDKCECNNGCDKCTVKYSLNVTNTTDDIMYVYSDSLISSNKDIMPFSGIEITRLTSGQNISLKSQAVKGISHINAKWSLSVAGAYNFKSKIKISKNIVDIEDMQELAKVCPSKVFSIKDSKLVVDEYKCKYCEACVDYATENGYKISIEPDEREILFSVETTGALSSKELVLSGCDVIENMLRTFLKDIEKL